MMHKEFCNKKEYKSKDACKNKIKIINLVLDSHIFIGTDDSVTHRNLGEAQDLSLNIEL